MFSGRVFVCVCLGMLWVPFVAVGGSFWSVVVILSSDFFSCCPCPMLFVGIVGFLGDHACCRCEELLPPMVFLRCCVWVFSAAALRCGFVLTSFKVFDNMLERDVVSWDTMISAFVQNGLDDEGLMLLYEMQKQQFMIDSAYSYSLCFNTSNRRNRDIGKQTHAYLLRHGIQFEGMESYLIDMYAKSGLIRASQQNFERNHTGDRDQATWNAMIAGYTRNGLVEEAFITFRQMFEQNFAGVMVVLVHLDILSIIESCFLDWWKVLGMGKYGTSQPMGHILRNNCIRLFFLTDLENFTLGVEMKEMEDWALVLVEALMREVDSVSLLRSKHYCTVAACFLWWLFYNSVDRGRATLEFGSYFHLFVWKTSSNYELGRGDKVGGWRPKPIPSLEDVHIIQIASGGYHSLALTVGSFFNRNQKVPVVIEALADERVVSIACGGSSSAAITEVQLCPVEVKFLTEDDGLEPHKVLSVAVGASHAMCLVSR
ncbi:hypothetical protein Pint_36698 [Pistacia integerrima]|uniref:Uncharacterized protein n=1 Tax=Pistacia integerrima TaxID=434235 RepID=A0ACC0Y2N2_9ROSI|nr:hypothetical protein Pint_36698 [Pistacia integerrima]